ncbi:hypothetical protein MPSEU_000058300 [Mayamaea pseudoterrestris]|nr:hypothetical protein MPSEU_000058300 [Mayamaea pseudoterrestris]
MEFKNCNVSFNKGWNALALWLEWLRIIKIAKTFEESVLDKLNGLGIQIAWNWNDPLRVHDMWQEDDNNDSNNDVKEELSDSNNNSCHDLYTQIPNAWDGKFECHMMDLEVYAPMAAAPAPVAAPTQRAAANDADLVVVAGLFAFGGAAAAASLLAPSAAPFMAPVVAHVAATVHGNYDGDGVRNAAHQREMAALEPAMDVRKRSIETHQTQGENVQKALHARKRQCQGNFNEGAETEANDSWSDMYQQPKEHQNTVTLAFELVNGSFLQRWCKTQQAFFGPSEVEQIAFALATAIGRLGLPETLNQNPFALLGNVDPSKAEQLGLPEMLNQNQFTLSGNIEPGEQTAVASATVSGSSGLPETFNQNPFTLSGNVNPSKAEQTTFALVAAAAVAAASGSLGLLETLNQNPSTLSVNVNPWEQTALASVTADIHRSNLDLPAPTISLVTDGIGDQEVELQAAAMTNLMNGVLCNGLIQEAMNAWGVASLTDFYFLSPDFLARPYCIQDQNKTSPPLQQLCILGCICWSFEQENQAIETWFNLDEEALLTFQRHRFTS